MPEPEIRTVTTLTAKRDEIKRTIAIYEGKVTQARADLAYVNATIALFERCSGEESELRPYVDLHRLLRQGELGRLCLTALASGPLDTRALAHRVAEAKGFDATDPALLKKLTYSVICSMRGMETRRKVRRVGKARTVTWAMP